MMKTVMRAIALSFGIGLGAIAEGWIAAPAQSAEEIRLLLGGPLSLSVSVESLETFAETGEITPELRPYAQFANDEAIGTLRQWLQRPFSLDAVTVSHLSYSPLGRDAIQQVGEFVRIDPDVNGFYGIRAAVLNAAVHNTDAEGWTVLDALREFPSDSVDVEVDELLAYWRSIHHYLTYNQAVVNAIQTEADAEAATQGTIQAADLPDLSQPGAYGVAKTTLTITNPALGQTQQGLTVNYSYDVDLYSPQGLTQPAPIVIISHGFGALKENFVFMAEHLASYGFVVLIPDHVGSDLTYRQAYLHGGLNTLLSPIEFVARPQEISLLIDELERRVATDAQWAAMLNLEQIGIMGDSFGSTTVFSLSGAEFNVARLSEQCQQGNRLLNFSLYIQCRAQYLPDTHYDLRDDRIKAAIAAHNLGYGLFGPEEVAAISIPLLMVSGSNDLVAPVVTEQFYPFIWLQTPAKYLALLTPGTHFSTKPEGNEGAGAFPDFLRGHYADYGQAYYKTLAVAFWNYHLRGDTAYQPYLTAAYGNSRSAGAPMALDIIQSLTVEAIEAAYGDRPPIPIAQPPASAVTDRPPSSVLANLEQTHVLRVALRRDAPPFGFLNAEDQWDGYCVDFANALRSHLEQHLRIDGGIEIAELPSNLDNRFDLVRHGDVHVECGPNTIRPIDGVAFSQPIFVAATRFFMQASNAANGELNPSLAGASLGVLPHTTTASFVAEHYPEANLVYFEGVNGRAQGVQAVADGAIAAFAGDDILTLGEAAQLNLSTNDYRLVPQLPLTCEFYGLLLPTDDAEWRRTVNDFIDEWNGSQTRNQRFQDLAAVEFNNLQYCLNR